MKKEFAGFLRHEEKWVKVVYDRYFALLKHQAYGILKDETEAENMAQETFLRALRNSDSFVQDKNFLAWLCTICRNLSLNRKKELERLVSIDTVGEESLVSSAPDPAKEADRSLLLDRIRNLLGKEDYDLLIYRLYFQLSYKEISEITNVNINTLLGRYHKIKNRLAKELKEEPQ